MNHRFMPANCLRLRRMQAKTLARVRTAADGPAPLNRILGARLLPAQLLHQQIRNACQKAHRLVNREREKGHDSTGDQAERHRLPWRCNIGKRHAGQRRDGRNERQRVSRSTHCRVTGLRPPLFSPPLRVPEC